VIPESEYGEKEEPNQDLNAIGTAFVPLASVVSTFTAA